ncbi:heterokaryon incompatibility protein-domain-containing protein [Cercophora samala]|uniref:Heterokaryon incompatibility protein-domain-containing protein n=1 Tax=Cercophora samala TaxID=330535 RepID=A0AA39ZE18_9PEZI|nr:heterokaryon incompatibility protein-domain-containing protein [Cercophora samala]
MNYWLSSKVWKEQNPAFPQTTTDVKPSHGKKRKRNHTPFPPANAKTPHRHKSSSPITVEEPNDPSATEDSHDIPAPQNTQRTELLGIDWTPCRGCCADNVGSVSHKGIMLLSLEGTCRWCRIIRNGLELYGMLDSLPDLEHFYICGWISHDQLVLRFSASLYFRYFIFSRDSKPKPTIWAVGLDSNRVALDAMSVEALQLAAQWLDECRHHHTECSSTRKNYFPKRVLDVSTDLPRLVAGPHLEDGPYIALSYCWGQDPQLKTNMASLETHKQGISPSKLPLTLQHAIHVTRQLGFRYLWVDALCIIQDSALDWDEQAAQMHHIYAGAALTIAADVGSSSASGLSSRKNRQLLYGQRIPDEDLRVAIEPYKLGGGFYFNAYRETPTHRPPISPRHHDSATAIGNHDSILQARAWAFQERNLSKRVLHFGEFEMGWECDNSTRCECTEQTRQDFPRLCSDCQTSTGARNLPSCDICRIMREKHLMQSGAQLRQFVRDCESGLYRLDTRNLFSKNWKRVVEDYSKRGLTVPSDRLPALSGLASKVATGLCPYTGYLAGLWTRNLARDLLWHTNKNDRGTRPEQYLAPTWSWASVQGVGVRWRDQMFASNPPTFDAVDASCTPQTMVNPFGAVKDGWIRARCFAWPFTVTPDQQLDFSHVEGEIEVFPDLGSFEEFESGQNYMMVQVHRAGWVYDGGGLIVRRSRRVSGAWERVGFYTHLNGPWMEKKCQKHEDPEWTTIILV